MSDNLNQLLIEKAKVNVAGGTNSMMRYSSYHLPLVIKKSEGVHVWDAEGNQLIDMNMGYGPLIFGHRSPIVIDAIKEEMDVRGTVLGFLHESSSDAAALIKKSIPSIELLRFSSSGTEVNQTAVRLARAYTKRMNLVVFEGHYHGSSDSVFHRYHAEIEDLEKTANAVPIPGTDGMGGAPYNVFRLQWNDSQALKALFEEKGETIAAVIMEPVMGNAGVIAPVNNYLNEVREITEKYGALLIFDEIITGFRIARGGAQERYGVRSDITTISKAMNGGVPVSAVGGRVEVMNLLVEGKVFHGGVYSGNPMCLAAVKAVQQEYERDRERIFRGLEVCSNLLEEGLQKIFRNMGIPAVVQAVGGMMSLAFVESPDVNCFKNYREIEKYANKKKYIKFQNELQSEGVYIHPNQFEPWYLSTLHTQDVIEEILSKIETAARRINWNDGIYCKPGIGIDSMITDDVDMNVYGKENHLLNAWERFEGKIDCEYTGRLWNARELVDLSKKVSSEMKDAGFGKGDIVALLLANTVAFPVVLMALLYLECNPLLLNAASPKPEFERMTKRLPIKYFIHDFIEEISRITTQEDITGKINIGDMTVKIGETGLADTDRAAGIYGVILHPTSGTYGEPGICIRNQEVAIAEGINYTSSIDLYDGVRIMITTPLSHAYGYGFGLMSSILTNSELVLSPSFNPKKVLRSLTKNTCDILTIVPSMARVLIMLKESYAEYGMAKNVFSAGAYCSETLAEKFEEVFDAGLYSIYGSTETGAISTNYTAKAKLPGVGKALKNVSVCLNNEDKYCDIGSDIGEVYVKSSSMMQGYYDRNSNTLEDINYFCTGDIGLIIDDSIILKGRIKDIINVDGMKVDGKEIENIILAYPGINDAVVYPGNNADNGEIVLCAFCNNDSPVDLDLLRAHCVKNMAYYKVPRAFYKMAELPRTASGKCIKVKLPEYKF